LDYFLPQSSSASDFCGKPLSLIISSYILVCHLVILFQDEIAHLSSLVTGNFICVVLHQNRGRKQAAKKQADLIICTKHSKIEIPTESKTYLNTHSFRNVKIFMDYLLLYYILLY